MNGFFNMYKPAGMSSAAVVAVLKRLTGEKRVGHAGTLDPAAAGVLPIMVGRATRLFDYLVDKQKEYVAVCSFGAATDTQDATGTVTETGDRYPSMAEVAAALPALTGEIRQKPSMYSAIKVGGKRLYALARQGETAEVPERTVRVDSIELLGEEPDHGVRIRVACGRGTYIRTLCADLGNLCGCPAHMRSLERTRSGVFSSENALSLEEAKRLAEEGKLAERMIGMDAALTHLRRMDVPDWMKRKVEAGAALPLDGMPGEKPEEGEPVRICLRGCFWGIGQRRENQLVWRAQIPPENGEEKR